MTPEEYLAMIEAGRATPMMPGGVTSPREEWRNTRKGQEISLGAKVVNAIMGPGASGMSGTDKVSALIGALAQGGRTYAGLKHGMSGPSALESLRATTADYEQQQPVRQFRAALDNPSITEDQLRKLSMKATGRYDAPPVDRLAMADYLQSQKERLARLKPRDDKYVKRPGGKQERYVYNTDTGEYETTGEITERWKPTQPQRETIGQRTEAARIKDAREWLLGLSVEDRDAEVRSNPTRYNMAIMRFPNEDDDSYRAFLADLESAESPVTERSDKDTGDEGPNWFEKKWKGTKEFMGFGDEAEGSPRQKTLTEEAVKIEEDAYEEEHGEPPPSKKAFQRWLRERGYRLK